MRPAFVWNPSYEVNIGKHVFPTQKFRLLKELLVEEGAISETEVILGERVSDADLLRVLDPAYRNDLLGYRHTPRTQRSELPITKEIIDGMHDVAGGTVRCAQLALERGACCHLGGGFHHGFGSHAEGFCYINDIAVAAAWARAVGGARRVTIIDTDVHQGNGTAGIFAGDADYFTFSIHEENNYPRIKTPGTLDIGLPSPVSGEEYLDRLDAGLVAAIDAFQPEFVIYAAGVDPYEKDVLGRLRLSWETMKRREELVLSRIIAHRIPFVTVVAGGYAMEVADTVALHAQTVKTAIRLLEPIAEGSYLPDDVRRL